MVVVIHDREVRAFPLYLPLRPADHVSPGTGRESLRTFCTVGGQLVPEFVMACVETLETALIRVGLAFALAQLRRVPTAELCKEPGRRESV